MRVIEVVYTFNIAYS